MNIGIDIRVLNTNKLTGIGSYTKLALFNLAKNYPADNFYLFSSGLKNELNIPEILALSNIHHYHWPESNKILNLKFLLGQGPRLAEVFGVDLDIFWLPNANFYKFSLNCPTIITIHDLSWLHDHGFYNLKMKIWHYLIGVKKLLTAADQVIAVSNNTKRDIIRFFNIADNKINVVYPGIESNQLDDVEAKHLLSNLNVPAKYWLYLGTLEPRKNIISVIKAFTLFQAKYSDQHLLLVGAKGWLYSSVWRALKNKKYLHYLGYLNNPQKDALYKLSQGLIWPSFYEGFGFPPLEALAQGVPVITSFKTSLPEILTDKAIYIDPYNVADIYQALCQLHNDAKLRQQFQLTDKNFLRSWQQAAGDLHLVFSQCINAYKK